MGLFSNPLSYAGYPPGVTGTPTTQNSTVRAATATEAATGTLTNVYISPATADSATALDFASPPVLGFGSTTPRPVHATTLDSTGDYTASGNVIINAAAKQFRVHGGAVTDFIGTGTLANGTVTIANTNIAATDRIFIQRIASNGSTTLGEFSYTISAATSFTVTSLILGTPGSTQTGDTSTFAYFIVRQV